MTDLRKLSEAATPGEWRCENGSEQSDPYFLIFNEPGDAYDEPFASMVSFNCSSDAAFIVALVNAYRSGSLIPRSEYERVQALLAEARPFVQMAKIFEEKGADTALSHIDDALAAEQEARG